MNLPVLQDIFILFSHILFTLILGYYFMSAMQWYGYKLQRVAFHYKRYDWHLYFFLFPLFIYYAGGYFFYGYLYLIYLPILYLWKRKLDKKLVFTGRVKRFFLFLILAICFQDILCFLVAECKIFGVILPLFGALFASILFEKILFLGYKKQAQAKIMKRKDLIIIAITASYGKTSIKKFLYQILSKKYRCYKTPRSVNTLGGIIKDINEDLPEDIEIYIVEAGARQKGDIDEIARFIHPHYTLVGQIGEQHIEYFKTLENIRNTKMELINSKRLKKAFVHMSANVHSSNDKITVFGEELDEIKATLDGVEFIYTPAKRHFYAPILGKFNATNLLACICIAQEFMSLDEIEQAIQKIEGVDHRLQKIHAGGKVIIDDSFNGNFEGMDASYELVKTYTGRKVIVTPGIVESTQEANIRLAKKIENIFDLAIITGKLNQAIYTQNITKISTLVVKDKANLEKVLQEETFAGDLILFSNDTPSFL